VRLGAFATMVTAMIAMALPICARAAVSECADPQRAEQVIAKALAKGEDRTRFLEGYVPALTKVGNCEQLGAVGAALIVIQQRRDHLHQRLAALGWWFPPAEQSAESRVMAVYETTIHELGQDYEAEKDYVSLVVLNRSGMPDARVQVELTGRGVAQRTVTLEKAASVGQVVAEDWSLANWLVDKRVEVADLRVAGADGQFKSVPFQVAEPDVARAQVLKHIATEDAFLGRVEAQLAAWQTEHSREPVEATH
jgi:hypothetical protein